MENVFWFSDYWGNALRSLLTKKSKMMYTHEVYTPNCIHSKLSGRSFNLVLSARKLRVIFFNFKQLTDVGCFGVVQALVQPN